VPLTLSHPAVVLPLRRLGLPLSALVVGSMVPDLPLYLGSQRGYDIAHSPLGVVTVDVVGALLVLGLWFAALRDPLADSAPSGVRDRVVPRARLSPRQWLLAPLGALAGAVTHLVWDSFTHPDRWGTEHVGWLRTDHLDVSGLAWAQYGSAVGGLLVLAAFVVAQLRRLPVIGDTRAPRALPAGVLPAGIALAGVAGLVAALRSLPDGVHLMALRGAVTSVVVLTTGLLVVCGAWHVAVRRHEQ
jgi:hypothetical protein